MSVKKNFERLRDSLEVAMAGGAGDIRAALGLDRAQHMDEKINAKLAMIFGLCISEYTKAGFSDEEIGILAALTARAGKGMC